MKLQQIDYSTSGQIAHIKLNAPQRFNAIDPPMAAELVVALQAAAADDEVRVVLLSGVGKAFCAGGDVNSFAAGIDIAALVRDLGRVAMLLRTVPKPVVAAVHRAAAGAGMGLAFLADFCIAADDTKFSTAFVRLALASDTGVGFVLTRTLGHLRAADLLLSGRQLSAVDAKALGLVTEVVPAEALDEATVDFVAGLVTGPRGAFAALKQQIWTAQFAGFEQYLAEEIELQSQCGVSADFAEGLAAFQERRAPDFT